MGWLTRKQEQQPSLTTATTSAPKGPQPGDRYEGPVTWTTDPHIGRPGYYALDEVILDDDGDVISHPVRQPHIMLTWVDAAPDDEEDGSGYFVVADSDGPYFTHQPQSLNEHSTKNIVSLQATAVGKSGVSVD